MGLVALEMLLFLYEYATSSHHYIKHGCKSTLMLDIYTQTYTYIHTPFVDEDIFDKLVKISLTFAKLNIECLLVQIFLERGMVT